MKLMIRKVFMVVAAIGLCADVLAEVKRDFANVSMCSPGPSKNPVSRDELVLLVVEGPQLSSDSTPIPELEVIERVNAMLRAKNASYIGVYTREGVKYGDVIRAIDMLRRTDAKNIGVSMAELPQGREL